MSKRKAKFRVGERVYDQWWPERHGEIIRVGKTRIRIQWQTVEHTQESYDMAYIKFLRREKGD